LTTHPTSLPLQRRSTICSVINVLWRNNNKVAACCRYRLEQHRVNPQTTAHSLLTRDQRWHYLPPPLPPYRSSTIRYECSVNERNRHGILHVTECPATANHHHHNHLLFFKRNRLTDAAMQLQFSMFMQFICVLSFIYSSCEECEVQRTNCMHNSEIMRQAKNITD